ncbi:hypothetical protein ACMGE6_01890 [Macrococcus equi]|uniref:hypothetical protein n=1 Tax=Macrococcus equi TaxID=3395462 RepID=UPI0039BDDDCE
MFHILPKRTKLSLWTSAAIFIVFVLYLIIFYFKGQPLLSLYYIALIPILAYTDYVRTVAKYLEKINDTANIITWENKKLLWNTIFTACLVLGIFIYSATHYAGFGKLGHTSVTLGFLITTVIELFTYFKEQRRYSKS